LIIDTLGTPSYEDTEYIASEKAKAYIRSLPYKKRVNYRAMYPNAPELALDLLEKMLTFAPEKRITVDEALAHPYLKLLHDPLDEPVAHAPFDVDFENIPVRLLFVAILYMHACHYENSAFSSILYQCSIFLILSPVHPFFSICVSLRLLVK
jgi:serine/threonine protein kinase